MHEPHITLVGNVGNDPAIRFTPNGVGVCELRVATTPTTKVGDEWVDKETLWFKVSCWRELGENVSQSLKKGDKVVVTGRLLQQTYERTDGTQGVSLVIDAQSVAVDLRRHPAKVMRPVREGSSAEVLTERWLDKETGEVLTDVVDLDAALAALEDATV